VQFRTIALDEGRKLCAYGLFSRFSERFSAILEDPSGRGRQYLVSKGGDRHFLDEAGAASDGSLFFRQWQDRLREAGADSPAIRCLIYAAYEAGGLIERLPAPKSAVPGPLLWALYPDYSLCFDPAARQLHLAARDASGMAEVLAMLDQAQGSEKAAGPMASVAAEIAATPADEYCWAVERVKQYIADGDIFQANIARFWQVPFAANNLAALYGRLRQVNPAPFSCLARIESGQGEGVLHLLSASPERLFRISADGVADTRPIAGTRRRGDGEDDDALRSELLLSEKERAEHIMLVDLERNDLGRVCLPGTVEVDDCMAIERYATVQHIVSNVRGELAEGKDVVDLFRAMFPGGTITGCPKIRCMEIIHELEEGARGPYTGGIGYVAWDGSADMNILIRTFWHHDGLLHWAAGAGIVADSDPAHELKETEHKAEGLLRALK